jgi:hypothetical protein
MREESIDALEDMVYQFGYHTVADGRPAIITGGLSALESAFSALGWEDPHFLPEEGNTCEIKGCMEEISSGMNWGDMYLSLCHNHTRQAYNKNIKRPEVKNYAIEREKRRDKITGLLK